MAQLQRLRSVNHGCRWRLAPPGENVDDDIGAMDALGQGLSTGGFDSGQAIAEHGSKNLHHLPVAIVAASELTPDPLQIGRQHPVLEWSPVPQSARLAGEDRHVMPGIVDCRATAKGTGMVGDDTPILADNDAIGIGLNVDRTADSAGVDRILIVIEAHQTGLRDRGLHFMEAVEAALIRYKLLPLFLKDVPDRFVGDLGVAMGALESQAGREEALTRQTDLVLDLPFFLASGRRASHRLDEIVAAHLRKTAIEEPVLADEDRLNGRFHIIVNATTAGAFEKGKGVVMRVEDHLLGLARIGTHKRHAAVTEPYVGNFHRHRRIGRVVQPGKDCGDNEMRLT